MRRAIPSRSRSAPETSRSFANFRQRPREIRRPRSAEGDLCLHRAAALRRPGRAATRICSVSRTPSLACRLSRGVCAGNSPGTIEHWLRNQYYGSEEEFVEAIAETMRVEYKAIVDAGFRLQIDDPDMPDGWLMYPDMTLPNTANTRELRANALNHALRDIPREKIRLHVCWGSFHGPHSDDIPLRISPTLSSASSPANIRSKPPIRRMSMNGRCSRM